MTFQNKDKCIERVCQTVDKLYERMDTISINQR